MSTPAKKLLNPAEVCKAIDHFFPRIDIDGAGKKQWDSMKEDARERYVLARMTHHVSANLHHLLKMIFAPPEQTASGGTPAPAASPGDPNDPAAMAAWVMEGVGAEAQSTPPPGAEAKAAAEANWVMEGVEDGPAPQQAAAPQPRRAGPPPIPPQAAPNGPPSGPVQPLPNVGGATTLPPEVQAAMNRPAAPPAQTK